MKKLVVLSLALASLSCFAAPTMTLEEIRAQADTLSDRVFCLSMGTATAVADDGGQHNPVALGHMKTVFKERMSEMTLEGLEECESAYLLGGLSYFMSKE